jgi:excisionase family DNA binding protein
MAPSTPKWVTVQTTAAALGMTDDQVYRAIREGKLPFRFVRIGKLIRINAADIGLTERQEAQTATAGVEPVAVAA